MNDNPVEDNVTAERTIVASATDKHYGFGYMIYLVDRLYCFYRDARSHTSIDGVCYMKYSDDNGLTWSVAAEVWDAAEVLTDFPQYLIDDPLAAVDVRDFKTIILPDGNLGVFGFVTIGHNLAADDTDPADAENIDIIAPGADYRAFCMSIPVDGNTIDINNKVITWIDTYPIAGTPAIDSGVIYAATYSTVVKLFKSEDNGATWSFVSNIFTVTSNECTMEFVGEVLYAINRNDADPVNHSVKRSNDYGATWEDETTIGLNKGGPASIVLANNNILVFGRNQSGSYLTYYKLDGLAITGTEKVIKYPYSADAGYGNVILKDGVYYFCYMNGPVRDYPNKYGHSYCGMYFRTMLAADI